VFRGVDDDMGDHNRFLLACLVWGRGGWWVVRFDIAWGGRRREAPLGSEERK